MTVKFLKNKKVLFDQHFHIYLIMTSFALMYEPHRNERNEKEKTDFSLFRFDKLFFQPIYLLNVITPKLRIITVYVGAEILPHN